MDGIDRHRGVARQHRRLADAVGRDRRLHELVALREKQRWGLVSRLSLPRLGARRSKMRLPSDERHHSKYRPLEVNVMSEMNFG